MKVCNILISFVLFMFVPLAVAGPHYVSGKIVTVMGAPTDPAIRITGNVSPELCDGGNYGWLYFQGTPEERQRTYATALALALSGHSVYVYTNDDGGVCRIINIQATL